MTKKPLILVTNDDGITAKGIKNLVQIASTIGEVVVVAPNSPQSGMGHAITINDPLRIYKSDIFEGILAYECSGTPVDCVKIAKKEILKDRKIDMVLSGINHGANSSISVIYSGTMSAAMEAAIEGLPAIGFSLCDYSHDAVFDHAHEFIKEIIIKNLDDFPQKIALNVNIPHHTKPIKGIKICRQAQAKWVEEYEKRTDPNGRDYYWASGYLENPDKGEDSDEYALKNGFISVVPCHFDFTHYPQIDSLKKKFI